MIFTVRMAIELGYVTQLPLYVFLVDLMKAYDSVSRVGLWRILERKGIPKKVVDLVRHFYEGK